MNHTYSNQAIKVSSKNDLRPLKIEYDRDPNNINQAKPVLGKSIQKDYQALELESIAPLDFENESNG